MEERIQSNIKVIFGLEYFGIRFEDTKEERGEYGLHSVKTAYYYSVPEASTLDVEDKSLNERIKTSDGLKHLAKEILIDMLVDNCKQEFDDDDFAADVKNNSSDYFKFYAKVRSGEIWNKELAEQRMKDLTKEIDAASGYKEI